MKARPLIVLAFLSLSLYGAMGSSVSVPTREHLKYTFGNHKNHPVQKQEEERYLRSLAPLKQAEIMDRLKVGGYETERIELRDMASELVYQVHALKNTGEKFMLYVDPSDARVLKSESIR
jgi:hypothetical protein